MILSFILTENFCYSCFGENICVVKLIVGLPEMFYGLLETLLNLFSTLPAQAGEVVIKLSAETNVFKI